MILCWFVMALISIYNLVLGLGLVGFGLVNYGLGLGGLDSITADN